MSDSKDFSVLTGEPIAATFQAGGRTYLFPADVPVPLMLKAERLQEQLEDDDPEVRGKAAEQLYQEALALAQQCDPTVSELPVNGAQLTLLIPTLYGGLDLTKLGQDDAEGPTRAKTPGATKPRTRKQKSRRSSTSSAS